MSGNGGWSEPSHSRDSRRSLVYEAERLVRNMFDNADRAGSRTVEVHRSRLTLPIERRFASLSAVSSYCERVLGLNWVRTQWDRASVPLTVRARRGAAAAHYEPATATLAIPLHRSGGTPWALRELVVLHELAHHLDPEPHVHHDHAFCERYLELVDGVIGAEAAFVLRSTLHDMGAFGI